MNIGKFSLNDMEIIDLKAIDNTLTLNALSETAMKKEIMFDNLPSRYIINKNATILFWEDGSKTVVKRAEEDVHDIAKSFLWAYFQKYCGMSKTQANKYLAHIVEENIEEVE